MLRPPYRNCPAAVVGCVVAAVLAGCGVQRTLVVNSDPPGALVYLNREEVGRTPLKHDFTWYGEYDVQLRKEGYQSVKATEWVVAPWWQWPPFDFFAELTPGHPHDTHRLMYVMHPATRPADPEALVRRAEGMRAELQSGQFTRTATRPATKPTTRASTRATTRAVKGTAEKR
jgi:hypothetical protein